MMLGFILLICIFPIPIKKTTKKTFYTTYIMIILQAYKISQIPCAHMEVVQVLATVEGEVAVHGYSGHGVSGYWTAIAVGALCARTLQTGTRPRAGVSRAWTAGWDREHSEGILLHNVGTILLGSQGPNRRKGGSDKKEEKSCGS